MAAMSASTLTNGSLRIPLLVINSANQRSIRFNQLAACGLVMDDKPGMLGQPCFDGGVAVSSIVVHH